MHTLDNFKLLLWAIYHKLSHWYFSACNTIMTLIFISNLLCICNVATTFYYLKILNSKVFFLFSFICKLQSLHEFANPASSPLLLFSWVTSDSSLMIWNIVQFWGTSVNTWEPTRIGVEAKLNWWVHWIFNDTSLGSILHVILTPFAGTPGSDSIFYV